MSEPVWITDLEAVALNHLVGLGGGPRDEHLLQAALARPLNKWHYDQPRPDLYALAAAYGFAIARSPRSFSPNNGIDHDAPEDEVVAVMMALADGALSEDEFASWLRQSSQSRA